MYARSSVAGQFRFRFWDFGRWKTVRVDDRLPSQKLWNAGNELIFARNQSEPHEFWIPLLEKAFAKYVGLLNSLVQPDVCR